MRRKVVISTAGSLGDLNPFIALALELKRRGYEPLIASQVEFRAKIEAAGIDFHPLRPGVAIPLSDFPSNRANLGSN